MCLPRLYGICPVSAHSWVQLSVYSVGVSWRLELGYSMLSRFLALAARHVAMVAIKIVVLIIAIIIFCYHYCRIVICALWAAVGIHFHTCAASAK